jgi:hypothetical protein
MGFDENEKEAEENKMGKDGMGSVEMQYSSASFRYVLFSGTEYQVSLNVDN